MNDTDHWTVVERIVIAVVGGLPATIAALAALLTALRAYRQATINAMKVDGLIGQLIQEVRDRARLEGQLEQQASDISVLAPPAPAPAPKRRLPGGPDADLSTPK